MKWRDVKEIPRNDQLVWVITNPHKQTVASCEIHCGWVFFDEENSAWCINNNDEIGQGAYCKTTKDPSFSERIVAWIPADEFEYPDWLAQYDGKHLDKN